MPREKADYRDLLMRLDEAYPGRELLKHSEIAAFLGVSARTVRRRYSFPQGRVPKTQIAREVSK